MRRVLFLLGSLALGCAPSGDDPNSVLSVYEPETGEYRLRYLAPPWELVSAEGTTAYLRIPSSSMIFGGDSGPPKYDLLATVESGTVETAVTREATAASARGDTIVEAPRAVQASDAAGSEVITQGMVGIFVRNRRYAFFPVTGGRVLRLAFDATPSVDTPEVDAMIAAVDVVGP